MTAGRVLWALLVTVQLLAQGMGAVHPGRRPFALVGADDGLPSGAAIAINQDPEGFIWLGTEHGLIRYNSGQCRHWTAADGLPSSFISQVIPATGGGLWLSTQGGVVRFQAGRFEAARLGGEVSHTPAGHMARDGQGRLWLVTAQGVFREKEGLEFARIPWNTEENLGQLMFGPRSGAMYLVMDSGVRAFHADGSIQFWGQAEGLPPGAPTALVEDGAGRLWAGSGRTLVMKEPDSNQFKDQSHRLHASLSPAGVAYLDLDGSIWLPTQDGAVHISGERTEPLTAEGGLPYRWVRTVFRDREGTLWVLGPTIARLLGGGRVWNYTLSSGTSGEIVWSMLRNREGQLLVGSDNGATRLGAQGLARIPGTEGRRIKAMTLDRRGTLWMVSTIGPTLWLRPGQSRAETQDLGEFGSGLNSVKEDSRGDLWLGHVRHGLLRWNPGSRKLEQVLGPEFIPSKPKRLAAFGIQEDALGRLWVGCSAGLLVRDTAQQWHFYSEKEGLRPNIVRDLAFLPDGSAWLHYQEPQGLTRVRLDGDQFRVLEHRTTKSGLRTDLIYGVKVDAKGAVWVSTDQGLDRLDPSLHIGRHDGMVSEDCSIHALLIEGTRIWVGTSGGLVGYESSQVEGAQVLPDAHIVQATFGKRLLEPPYTSLGRIPYQENTVEFRVAAPTYTNERELQFQVRLNGLEEGWRDLEGRVARYPALNGRHYRFEVRAACGNGGFGPIEVLDFTIRPPWWKTGWFYTFEALCGLGLVSLLIRRRVAALAASKAELEALVGQRTEELRHRNEDLSAALDHVKQLSGLLPICASCKMIRDDQGSWTQLERYITQHSEADFTHGICPDCAKTLYPELGQRSD